MKKQLENDFYKKKKNAKNLNLMENTGKKYWKNSWKNWGKMLTKGC